MTGLRHGGGPSRFFFGGQSHSFVLVGPGAPPPGWRNDCVGELVPGVNARSEREANRELARGRELVDTLEGFKNCSVIRSSCD